MGVMKSLMKHIETIGVAGVERVAAAVGQAAFGLDSRPAAERISCTR